MAGFRADLRMWSAAPQKSGAGGAGHPFRRCSLFARTSTAGLLAVLALSLPADPAAPSYTLESTGALRLATSGAEATYGLVPEPLEKRPVIAISLGATKGDASLVLFTYADMALIPGRYPVGSDLPTDPDAGRRFHPCFVAGTFERPQGFFHGETGWVTITAAGEGRIAGEFEIRARGFLADDEKDENRWVTVRGRFDAVGDSTVTGTSSVFAVTR